MSRTPRVGFIGLGHQGTGIALRMARQGLRPTVWARRPEAIDPLRGLDVTVASSPSEVGAASDVVGLCLFDIAGLDEVAFGPHGLVHGMAPAGCLIVHSTVAPDEVTAFAARAAEHGLAVLDAPVSGGPDAAEAGELAVIVGGDADVLERCRPVLDSFANPVVAVGGVGAGQMAKLLNNTVFSAQLGVAIDVLRLGAALGMSTAGLVEVIRASSGRSYALDVASNMDVALLAASNARPTLTKDVDIVGRLTAGHDTGALLDAARHLVDLLAAART